MKIVVALASPDNTLFFSEAGETSCKSNPKSGGAGYFLTDKEIYDFMLSKFPLSFTTWTHIDLEIDL